MPTTTYTIVHGEVLSENRNGTERAYLFDVIGSTMALADSSQTITDTFSYWPFGEQKSHAGVTATPLLFLGAYGATRDSATRTHIGAREFRTNLARWSQKDRLRADRTRYSYAFDNPISYHDANGLYKEPKTSPPPAPSPEAVPKPSSPGVSPVPAPPPPSPLVPIAQRIVIVAGAIAIWDLATWGVTGNEGPITGIGGNLGRWIWPDPTGLPAPTREEWCAELAKRGMPCTEPPWLKPRTPPGPNPCSTKAPDRWHAPLPWRGDYPIGHIPQDGDPDEECHGSCVGWCNENNPGTHWWLNNCIWACAEICWYDPTYRASDGDPPY